MTITPDIDKAMYTRFARLFLDHRAEARVADLSDAAIIEQTGAIFIALMAVVVAAERQGDQAALAGLQWFTRACGDEIDETPRALLDG